MINKLAPILHSKWEADETDEWKINGNWAEDMSPYEISVPPQIRDNVIAMQNWLAEHYEKIETTRLRLNRLESFF